MAASDDLFTLIHSLTKAEKRYFKLFAELGAGRAHVHSVNLFDHIDRMDEYDEDQLKKILKDPALVQNLATGKTRLNEMILKSQRLMQSGESIDSQIGEYLQDLEFLFEKQLVKTARKRLKKAKTLALAFEKESFLLKILDWEQRFFVLEPNEEEDEFYKRNEEEETQCTERLNLQRSLTRLYERIRSLWRQGLRVNVQENLDRYIAIITHPDLQNPKIHSAFLTKALFISIKGYYATAQGKYEMAWEEFNDLVKWWDAHPERIHDLADFYLGSMNNHLNLSRVQIAHQPQFLSQVKILREQTGLPAATKLKFDRLGYYHELNAQIYFGDYSNGKLFIEELADWLNANEDHIQNGFLLEFYYNISLFLFYHSEFSQAQKWVRKIVNFPATEAKADVRDFSRIFQLVLQYELGNLDVQEYMLRSSYRYFQRTQKLFDLEESLIQFMKDEQKTGFTDPDLTRTGIQNLKDRWTALLKEEGPQPIGLQTLLLWAECKLEGKSMKEYHAQLVKGRLKNAGIEKWG